MYIADTRGFIIVNITTGEQQSFDFPYGSSRVIQCAIDNMEHAIITRSVVYMMNDQYLCWDSVVPVHYTRMSFANNRFL